MVEKISSTTLILRVPAEYFEIRAARRLMEALVRAGRSAERGIWKGSRGRPSFVAEVHIHDGS
jgi:hypothetical protein